MQSLINALLNMFLVSLPEELFVVAIVLIGIGRDDLLDLRMWKDNIRWVALPAIGMSFIVSFARLTNISKSLIQITGILVLFLLTLVVIKNNNLLKEKIKYFKTLFYTTLGIAIISILECYYPLILSLTKTNILYINSHFILNFLCALPARVIEYSILVYLLVKKSDDVKIKLFDIILKNSFLKRSMFSLLIGIMITMIYLIKLIGIDLILINLSFFEQLIIVVMMFIIPTITITFILLIVNYILKVEKRIRQTYENLAIQDVVMDDVENDNKGGEF